MTTTLQRYAALRAPTTFSDSTLRVDADAGILYGAALMHAGPAVGHGFECDATTLAQLVALVNANPDGIKSRFKHPKAETAIDPGTGKEVQSMADSTGTMVARIKNARLDGDAARGDVYLGAYASNLPGMGDVRTYILTLAQDDPAAIGLSAVIEFDVEPETDGIGNVTAMPARLTGLQAIDFTEEPAANPRGLLKRGQMFDPQPPSGTADTAGWQDQDPADPAKAPKPDDFGYDDDDFNYLRAMTEFGPHTPEKMAARFGHSLADAAIRLSGLDHAKVAEKKLVDGKLVWNATPAGMTGAALRWGDCSTGISQPDDRSPGEARP